MNNLANKSDTIISIPIKDSKINFSFITKSKDSDQITSSNFSTDSNKSRFEELKSIKKNHE